MKSIIQSPTNNLQNSLDFYTKLGFTVLSNNDTLCVSDGKVIIEINPDRYARAGVKLISEDWSETLTLLENTTEIVKTPHGHILNDPSGTWIYLADGDPNSGPDISNIQPSIIGNFAGLTLESIGINRSFKIWELLGFKHTMGSADKGWVGFSNDELPLSIMKPQTCPHLFFNPSLSYFNGKENLNVIEKIQDVGIPITEEITYFNKEGIIDNVIIRDPGGYGFFIFSD